MSSALSTIHVLAGLAAEINEAEAALHRAAETLAGVRAQMLYTISEASRPVDPEPRSDDGAAAPGKPPRPTEGGVAVTEGGVSLSALSEEGSDGLAGLGAGARAFSGGAVIPPKADQALDGAGLEEGTPRPDDPRPALEQAIHAGAVLELYGKLGVGIHITAETTNSTPDRVRSVIRMARWMQDPRVIAGDVKRQSRGLTLE